ncbi:RNA polymerase sigma factor [Salibacterium halotolerans]|uniref:RNA polymerase sigma-70 factor, ECF subfamily n=1 Tax=Salibacterium halotolerans TaxID=1884432 RepID=A0A1I5TTS7_9BACI|nr:sigma-70 family RNA polymerase sigma factor [Salibacterium halotolerans]SFP86475.1 RNA polymerase sigma-70 factor, ECF subfamily [Salibacterium halotolerans]
MKYDREAADEFLTQKDKNEERFICFYEAYSPLIYTIALKLLKDEKDAEDLVQEVCIEIYRYPHQFDPERGSVRSWVAVKARSRCMDRLRKRSEVVKEDIEVESTEQIEEEVVKKLEWEKTKRMLSRLPEKQKNAVIGNYLYDQSHAQLASSMKKPLGTVKSWVRQGIQSLQKQWFDDGSKKKSRDKHDL